MHVKAVAHTCVSLTHIREEPPNRQEGSSFILPHDRKVTFFTQRKQSCVGYERHQNSGVFTHKQNDYSI